MTSNCSLSVIVANYNRERYLAKCLGSILNQTFKDLEIVVVDDGSTDGSPLIIQNNERKYPGVIRGIYIPENRGVAYARHQAVLVSRGEYLTTLDSDDYYFSGDKLAREMDLMRAQFREKGREIIAFSNTVMVNAQGKFLKREGNSDNIRQGDVFESFLTRTGFIPRDFIMKKDGYLTAGGYDTCLRIREDWDLKIRLARRYEFYYSGVDGTAYRRHAGTLSASSSASVGEWERWLRIVFSRNIDLAPPERREAITGRFEAFLAERRKDFSAPGVSGDNRS